MVTNLVEAPKETMPEHVDILVALGQSTRLRIMRLLKANGELCGIELRRLIKDVDQPTISHHMAYLAKARLVEVRRVGLYKYYSVNKNTLTHITAFLATL